MAKTLGANLVVRLSTVALILELVGLATSLVCMFRREWRGIRRPHAQFSHELDQAFVHYMKLVASLRVHPKLELQRRLRYLKARKASLVYRTGLFSGNMERLGALPLLVVLYVQFKDWRWRLGIDAEQRVSSRRTDSMGIAPCSLGVLVADPPSESS